MKPLAALCLSLTFALPAMAAIEEPAFDPVKTDGDFEIRLYKPMVVAETWVAGDLSDATNGGFRLIAGYIFGNNLSAKGAGSEKVAMTAPVTVEAAPEKIAMTAPVTVQDGGEGRYRIHFVMPSRYTLATLPRPVDDRVKLREVPAQRMAVIRFSGLAGEEKVKDRTEALLARVRAEGLEPAGAPQLARYDPPWTLPFLRRNEVLLPLR